MLTREEQPCKDFLRLFLYTGHPSRSLLETKAKLPLGMCLETLQETDVASKNPSIISKRIL